MKFEWENIYQLINDKSVRVTQRSKVLGGWIIYGGISIGNQFSTSMVFVPDPNHLWEIDKT